MTLTLVSRTLRHVWGGILTNRRSTLRSDNFDTIVHGALKCSIASFWTYLGKIRSEKGKKRAMRRPGIEPEAQAWEARMLPLHHRRVVYDGTMPILEAKVTDPHHIGPAESGASTKPCGVP